MDKPTCSVKGKIHPGAMCSMIIVGLKYCAYKGECEHKVAPQPVAAPDEQAGTKEKK